MIWCQWSPSLGDASDRGMDVFIPRGVRVCACVCLSAWTIRSWERCAYTALGVVLSLFVRGARVLCLARRVWRWPNGVRVCVTVCVRQCVCVCVFRHAIVNEYPSVIGFEWGELFAVAHRVYRAALRRSEYEWCMPAAAMCPAVRLLFSTEFESSLIKRFVQEM